ncbi:formate dehydrogenase accessory sulfurtransferase FdhD [soil metagenome]
MRTDRRPGPTIRTHVVEWRGDTRTEHEDRLATEEPLELRLAWPGRAPHRFVVTMRTPGNDFELAAGLAHGEGLVSAGTPPATVAYCTDTALAPDQEFNVVTLTLSSAPQTPPTRRATTMSGACGVCGRDSLDAVAALGGRRVPARPLVARSVIAALPDRLRAEQAVFERTGGLHGAGLFTPDGTSVVVREDIGRHNATDKVVGERLLAGGSAEGLVLAVSGRIGYEIVQKAVLAGVVAVVAVGAPSSLAVELAREFGLTVVGWVRDDRIVVHAHPERITG